MRGYRCTINIQVCHEYTVYVCIVHVYTVAKRSVCAGLCTVYLVTVCCRPKEVFQYNLGMRPSHHNLQRQVQVPVIAEGEALA